MEDAQRIGLIAAYGAQGLPALDKDGEESTAQAQLDGLYGFRDGFSATGLELRAAPDAASARGVLLLPFKVSSSIAPGLLVAALSGNGQVEFDRNVAVTLTGTGDRLTQAANGALDLGKSKIVLDYSDTSASTQFNMANVHNGTIEIAAGRNIRRLGRLQAPGQILRDLKFRSVDYTSESENTNDAMLRIETSAPSALLDNVSIENIGYGIMVLGTAATVRNLTLTGVKKGLYGAGCSGAIIIGLRFLGASPLSTAEPGINAVSGQWNNSMFLGGIIGPSLDGVTLPNGPGEHGIYLAGNPDGSDGNNRVSGYHISRTNQCGGKFKDMHDLHVEDNSVQQANYSGSPLVNKEGWRFERIKRLTGGNLSAGPELIAGVQTGYGGYTHMFFGPCSGVQLLKESYGERCLAGGVRFAVDGVDPLTPHGDYVIKLRHKNIGGPSIILDDNIVINDEILIYLHTDGCPASPVSIGAGITFGANGKVRIVGTYKNCGAPPPLSTANIDLSDFKPAARSALAGILRPETQALLNSFDVIPSRKALFAIDDAIDRLVEDGIWPKLRAFWGGMAGASQINSLRNWKDPIATDLFVAGTPVFTAKRGWASDGTSGLLNTSISWTSFGGQNDKVLGLWASNDVVNDIASIGSSSSSGASGLDRIAPRVTGNLASFRVSSGTSSTVANAVATGHYSATRRLSTDQELYKDGALLSSASLASSGVSGGTVRLLGSGAAYSTTRIAAAYIGAGLTAAEIASVDAALRGYMTAVGVV